MQRWTALVTGSSSVSERDSDEQQQSHLANQLGSIEYSRPRRFCQKLEQWLKMIRVLWPDCPAQINRAGDALLVSRGSAVRAAARIST